jgi:hypothetical protein
MLSDDLNQVLSDDIKTKIYETNEREFRLLDYCIIKNNLMMYLYIS